MAFHLAFAISCIGGYTIKTGGASGIDEEAMRGTRGKNLEVYLPWDSYSRERIPREASVIVFDPIIHGAWVDGVGRFCAGSDTLSGNALAIHACNFGTVIETKGVIALPRDDGEGITGEGIRIARAHKIPVVQGNTGDIEDVPRFIGRALQILGLVSKELKPTLLGR